MKILITGGTGFIGRDLCVELLKMGHELTLVTRNQKKALKNWPLPSDFIEWDLENSSAPTGLDPDNFDALIHLAGENIAGGLWTKERKKRLMDSRTKTSKALEAWLTKRSSPIPLVLSASAIGYYSDQGDEWLDESSPAGSGFLSEICKAWEASVLKIPSQREVRVRIGLVMGDGGGFLLPLRRLTQYGLGQIVGDGKQYMSWIHKDDLIKIFTTALDNAKYQGPINAVAPNPVTQKEFQQSLSKLMIRPQWLTLPAFLPKVAIGEMSTLILGSQRVRAKSLEELAFVFAYPDLSKALEEVLDLVEKKGRRLPCHRLETQQFVPRPLEEVAKFFSLPQNLEQLTPAQLSFSIESVSTPQLQNDTVIFYKLKLHGIPMRWKTRLMDWNMPHQFSDNQEKGPYAIWYHTHSFYAVKGGTLMTDRVRYRLPMGWLGDLFAYPYVKREVRGIFAFRRLAVDKEFPRG